MGILGNSGISGELSAIPAEFVLAQITKITFRQSAGNAEMFAGIARIAKNSQILYNTLILYPKFMHITWSCIVVIPPYT